MADVVIFHHALGLTEGVQQFADALRSLGHEVTTPDLFEGRLFTTLDEGVAYAQSIGWDTVIGRGFSLVADVPRPLVTIGMSLGCLPAQALAQRGDAAACILAHSLVPFEAFGGVWPEGVPLQIHISDNDPWEDMDVVTAQASATPEAFLYLYPGEAHTFLDSSSDEYNEAYRSLALGRIADLLDNLSLT
jgi:dienelactone hydrolase